MLFPGNAPSSAVAFLAEVAVVLVSVSVCVAFTGLLWLELWLLWVVFDRLPRLFIGA